MEEPQGQSVQRDQDEPEILTRRFGKKIIKRSEQKNPGNANTRETSWGVPGPETPPAPSFCHLLPGVDSGEGKAWHLEDGATNSDEVWG